MWNNKMDNILVYHRPFAQTQPQDPTCEFHSKKVRRQKTVGKKGSSLFQMLFSKRRFIFSGKDPLEISLKGKNLSFEYSQKQMPLPEPTNWTPALDINGEAINF
jgi:hypothetical protein